VSRQFTWRVPGRHAGRDGVTSYQLRQLGQRDWYLSHASLSIATQFHEYLAPYFLFLPLHFLSFYVLSPHRGGSIGDWRVPTRLCLPARVGSEATTHPQPATPHAGPGPEILGAQAKPINLGPLYNHIKIILNILYNKNYLLVILVGKNLHTTKTH
jgi:hypothetical protein